MCNLVNLVFTSGTSSEFDKEGFISETLARPPPGFSNKRNCLSNLCYGWWNRSATPSGEVCSRAVRVSTHTQSAHSLHARTLTQFHTYTHSARLTMLCWWTSRGRERCCPMWNKKGRKKRNWDCVAMQGMELNNTHTSTQSSGGMWCHFTHSSMSVNQFITFFYRLLQAALRVVSVQLVCTRIIRFFSGFCAAREKNRKGKLKGNRTVDGWLWWKLKSIQYEFVIF